jgi:predicted RNase H-like HicB family nuclease
MSFGILAALESSMRNEFTAIIEQDGPWYVAYCAEVPGANGQGKSREECLANLREGIALILEHRREETLRSLPTDAGRELVVIG